MKKLLLSIFAILFTCSNVNAALVYSNGSPDNTLIDWFSDFATYEQQVASAFSINDPFTGINMVSWFGAYESPENPFPGAEPVDSDSFTIRIFEDSGTNRPTSTPLYQYLVGDLGRTDTGQTSLNGADVFAYSTFIPLTILSQGITYWISIVNDTSSDSSSLWNWSTASSNGSLTIRNGDSESWRKFGNPGSMAFSVSHEVPEPATLGLFGLALLAIRRFRRS